MTALTLRPTDNPVLVPAPGFVQNLSASVSLLVSSPSNPTDVEGVIGPGVSANVSTSIYIRSDGSGTASVIVSNQSGLDVTSSTNVVATVPGAVQISPAQGAIIPVSGTVNAQITNASIPVSGNINVSNSINISSISGGTVNIGQGNITSQQAWNVLYTNSNITIPAGTSYTQLIGNVDVSSSQSISIFFGNVSSSSFAVSGITIGWLDSAGNFLYAEEVLGWAFGRNMFTTSVKAPRITINYFIDYGIFGSGNTYSSSVVTIWNSSIAVPELYYAAPANTPGLVGQNSWTSFTPPSQTVATSGNMNLRVQDSGSSKTLWYGVASYNREMVVAMTYVGNATGSSGEFSLGTAVKGASYQTWSTQIDQLFSGLGTNATNNVLQRTIIPKAPLIIGVFGSNCTLIGNMAYERF